MKEYSGHVREKVVDQFKAGLSKLFAGRRWLVVLGETHNGTTAAIFLKTAEPFLLKLTDFPIRLDFFFLPLSAVTKKKTKHTYKIPLKAH